MPNQIPQEARAQVEGRDLRRCVRCGSTNAPAWHHRQRRRDGDREHQHCACNGVLLCPTCHSWVHNHPFEARRFGFIVSAYQSRPGQSPVTAHFGTILLDCEGRYTPAPDG